MTDQWLAWFGQVKGDATLFEEDRRNSVLTKYSLNCAHLLMRMGILYAGHSNHRT